jgi:hypothetical protein
LNEVDRDIICLFLYVHHYMCERSGDAFAKA